MTRQEAIEKLKRERNGVCRGCAHPSMVGWCENHCKLPEAYDMAIDALGRPEIVYCKDCVHSPHTVDGKIRYCKRHARYKPKDYFCGDAERRTDE